MANFEIRINHATTTRCNLQLWLDGDNLGQLEMRNAQLRPLLHQLQPDPIWVDRDNCTDDIRRRLHGYAQVRYF